MNPINSPITGEGSSKGLEIDYKIYETLNQFYKAFNNKNFELMQKNWLNSEEIAMANPLGGIKKGWKEINSMYQRIFLGKANVYVEFYDYLVIKMDGGFCAIGRERGHVEQNGEKLELVIRTSRIYKLIENEYKQIHHHGSIEKPQLLQQYQTLVK